MLKNLNFVMLDLKDKYQILPVAYKFTYQSVTGLASTYPGFMPL